MNNTQTANFEQDDNQAWEVEVKQSNTKLLRGSFLVLPISYSGSVLFGVYLSMNDRFWEFVPVYVFPSLIITILYFIRKKNIAEHYLIKFLPDVSLFTCTAIGAAMADHRFLFYATLVNFPVFLALAMGALRKNSETLSVIIFGGVINVLIFLLLPGFKNYGNIIAGWCMVLPIAIMSYFLAASRYNSQKTNFLITRALDRSNKFLEIKNKETELQKKEIEEKQKEIIDSIHYAKRIQTAHLPNEKFIEKTLNKLQKKG